MCWRFDLPFLDDEGYWSFLNELGQDLASVYVGLGSPLLADARPLLLRADPDRVLAGLAALPGPAKYLLANAGFQNPASLLDARAMRELAALLDRFLESGQARGLVYADPHLLFALARTSPDTAKALEATPSVNLRLDRLDAFLAQLELVEAAGFRQPSRLVPDRSLNRRLPELETLAGQLERRLPGVELFLLANEGCLYQCPFKGAHDAMVAGARASLARGGTGENEADAPHHDLARELGCLRRFAAEPWRVLQSPFIRPEDLGHYEGLARGLKLTGRNREPSFVIRAVEAYRAGVFEGNLLELCDVLENLAPRLRVDNARLPGDFLDRVGSCDKDCRSCGWCVDRARDLVETRPPGLERLP